MNSIANLLSGLCPEGELPETISIYENGTRSILMLMNDDAEGAYYCGTPVWKDRNGKEVRGRHPLTLTRDGQIHGTFALNVILNGGWEPGKSKVPTEDERHALRVKMQSALVTTLALFKIGQSEVETKLEEAIEAETGLKVVKEKMTSYERSMVAHLPYHLIELLSRKGWKLEVKAEDLVRRLGRYCDVVKGPWSREADTIAITGGMRDGQIMTLREGGYTLRNKKRSRSRRLAK